MPLSEITIETREPAHAAVVRRKAPQPELSNVFGECFGEVFGLLAQRGIEPTSAPFARYTGMGDDFLEVEAGAMVAEPFAPAGNVVGITIPGGEVATAIHFGPYDDLPTSNHAITAWIERNGRTLGGPPIEEYINDPGDLPPAEWQTKISFPLA